MTYSVVYVLRKDDNTYLLDPPEKGESVLRAFSNHEDCRRYGAHHNKDYRVVSIEMVDLWSALPTLNEQSVRMFKSPIRVELCRFTDHVIEVRSLRRNFGIAN